MKLPLELREEFGKYAFPDENYGAKAIEPILPFLESIADVDDSEHRQIQISLNKDGTVEAQSKKLSNIRLNLSKAMSPQEIVEVMSMIWGAMNINDPLTFFFLILQFLKWSRDLATIDITTLEAQILYKFYEKAASGMVNREILRKDFEVYVQSDIAPQTLNSSLEKLEKLGCIILTVEKIRLVEQIIFVSEYEDSKSFKTS
jgi:hypothetical protein